MKVIIIILVFIILLAFAFKKDIKEMSVRHSRRKKQSGSGPVEAPSSE